MAVEADSSGPGTIDSRPEYYIKFLDSRTAIDDEVRVKQLIMDLLEPGDGISVLDVGTGTGDDARQIANLVAPHGKVVGLDRSPDMVTEARQRANGTGLPVEFVEGEAQALDFADGSFDRCRAERVLSHMSDPAPALREMVRVARPGGIVLVSDVDAGTIFVNSSNEELATGLALGLTDSISNGRLGRRLHRHFIEAGLDDVRCVTSVIQNNVALMRVVFANQLHHMVAAGQTSAEDVADFWAELEEGERAGWLCSGVICFTVVGHKPH